MVGSTLPAQPARPVGVLRLFTVESNPIPEGQGPWVIHRAGVFQRDSFGLIAPLTLPILTTWASKIRLAFQEPTLPSAALAEVNEGPMLRAICDVRHLLACLNSCVDAVDRVTARSEPLQPLNPRGRGSRAVVAEKCRGLLLGYRRDTCHRNSGRCSPTRMASAPGCTSSQDRMKLAWHSHPFQTSLASWNVYGLGRPVERSLAFQTAL